MGVVDAWESEGLEDVLLAQEMDFVQGDMCRWNTRDSVTGLHNLKPTGFAVHRGALAERLSCRCCGKPTVTRRSWQPR